MRFSNKFIFKQKTQRKLEIVATEIAEKLKIVI